MRLSGWIVGGWIAAVLSGTLLVLLADGFGVRWAEEIRPVVGTAVFLLGGGLVVAAIVEQSKRGGK